jgi:hypothetical protein
MEAFHYQPPADPAADANHTDSIRVPAQAAFDAL